MEVIVYMNKIKVGTLYEQGGVISFEYEKDFIDLGLNISPIKLPFDTTTYVNLDDKYYDTLAGVFHDSLPDKFGTKVVERYYESLGIAPRELSTLQKLVFIGDRGMGSLEYEPKVNILDDKEILESLEIKNLYEESKKIIKGKTNEVISSIFMESGASAGGARAKAVVGWDRKNNKLVSGASKIPDGFEYWLIKFDNEDNTVEKKPLDFTKLEFLYMSIAKKCGITIPEIRLIKSENLTHFAIKRFDRKDGEKIHMHSLASMLHLNFNIPKHFSYDETLRVVWRITKDKRDVLEMYKRAVFNIISRNQDDHAKNTSFLMDEYGNWRLSPAYDITYAHGSNFTKNHQMSVVGKVNNFTKKDLLLLASKNDIKESIASKIIDDIVGNMALFEEKATQLHIRKDLVKLVKDDIRIDL